MTFLRKSMTGKTGKSLVDPAPLKCGAACRAAAEPKGEEQRAYQRQSLPLEPGHSPTGGHFPLAKGEFDHDAVLGWRKSRMAPPQKTGAVAAAIWPFPCKAIDGFSRLRCRLAGPSPRPVMACRAGAEAPDVGEYPGTYQEPTQAHERHPDRGRGQQGSGPQSQSG